MDPQSPLVPTPLQTGGPDLDTLLEPLLLRGDQRALDLSGGLSPLGAACAERVAELAVLAPDAAALAQARRAGQERGLANLRCEHGRPEALHYPDAQFDLIILHYGAHRLAHPAQALAECARVLAPDGLLVLADVVAPELAPADTLLNTVALLRDPRHARFQRAGRWQALCEEAGLAPALRASWLQRLDLPDWLAAAAPDRRAHIQALLAQSAPETRAELDIGEEALSLPAALLHAWPAAPPPPEPICLETPRLLLREHQPDDWRAIYAFESDPENARYLDQHPRSEAEIQLLLPQVIAWRYARPRLHYAFAMVRRADQALIGWCTLHLRGRQLDAGEIGYALRRDCWGQGYATETARALLRFGFEQLGLRRISAECHPDNTGSWRVMEKAGMRREGLLRQNTCIRGAWTDTLVYAMVAEDWSSRL